MLRCTSCCFQAVRSGQFRSSVGSAEHHQQTSQERENAVLPEPGDHPAAAVTRPRRRPGCEYGFTCNHLSHTRRPAGPWFCCCGQSGLSLVSTWLGRVFCLGPKVLTVLLTTPQKLTEQRLPVFSHEIVPDYLRTKPDPEVEEQEKQLSAEAARMGVEVAQVSPAQWPGATALRSSRDAEPLPGGLRPAQHMTPPTCSPGGTELGFCEAPVWGCWPHSDPSLFQAKPSCGCCRPLWPVSMAPVVLEQLGSTLIWTLALVCVFVSRSRSRP